jgi:hypothetical protein
VGHGDAVGERVGDEDRLVELGPRHRLGGHGELDLAGGRPAPSRHVEAEGAALAQRALHAEPAAVRLDELAADGEADAAALGRVGALLELVEDALVLLRGDAGPRIPNAHPHAFVLLDDDDLDRPAAGRVLHRVAEEVPRDLADAQRVRLGDHRSVGATDVDDDAGVTGTGLDEHLRVHHGLGDVDAGEVEVDGARLDLADVEELVDEAQQVAAGPRDVLHVAQLPLA